MVVVTIAGTRASDVEQQLAVYDIMCWRVRVDAVGHHEVLVFPVRAAQLRVKIQITETIFRDCGGCTTKPQTVAVSTIRTVVLLEFVSLRFSEIHTTICCRSFSAALRHAQRRWTRPPPRRVPPGGPQRGGEVGVEENRAKYRQKPYKYTNCRTSP